MITTDLTAADREFIAREQSKQNASLRRDLLCVETRGEAPTQDKLETLLVNNLVELTGPCGLIPYNHHRLTSKGKEVLESLRPIGRRW